MDLTRRSVGALHQQWLEEGLNEVARAAPVHKRLWLGGWGGSLSDADNLQLTAERTVSRTLNILNLWQAMKLLGRYY